MRYPDIKHNIENVRRKLPDGVLLVAVAKTRTTGEVRAAIDSGVTVIGENYVQETVELFEVIGHDAVWHFIGHLQKNKVKKAVEIFDMIETVDSYALVKEIDKRCEAINKIMPILVEINSGRELQKFGVFPDDAVNLIKKLSEFSNIKVQGLMTMGPFTGSQEDARPYFIETRKIFEELKKTNIPGVEMKYLSMGMTNSYTAAIEEGANIVRIGTEIFGVRT